MKKLILASASPRRKQLLEQIGLSFEIVPSNIEETLDTSLTPQKQVEALSKQKAQATATLLQTKDAVILSADTMVVIGNDILGKPKDTKDAIRMLRLLSGKQHQIVTGYTLLDAETKKEITNSTTTNVWFRELSEEEIQKFVATPEPYDKAGSYALQEKAAIFIEKIEGDYSGAVGLPIFAVAKDLQEFGINVL